MLERNSFSAEETDQKSLELLDKIFNDQTKFFLKKQGLREGMSVLDIGCGLGLMTQFLAAMVGETGRVIAVDNSKNQIQAAENCCPKHLQNRITWYVLDIYDLEQLKNQFDLVYCRFVLHNLYKPRFALSQIEKVLKLGGVYIGIEGIINNFFSFPEHSAWQSENFPTEIPEGMSSNGNIGKILPCLIRQANMLCVESAIYQPMLMSSEDRQLLLQNKCLDTLKYQVEEKQMKEWQKKYQDLKYCVEDAETLIAFYAANFTASTKKISQIIESKR
jgi:SAM-dependent methyltransferase